MRNVNYINSTTKLLDMVGSYIEEKNVLSVYNCVFGNDIAVTIRLFYDTDIKDIYVQSNFDINTTKYITGSDYTVEVILYKSFMVSEDRVRYVFDSINRIFFDGLGEYCEVAHE